MEYTLNKIEVSKEHNHLYIREITDSGEYYRRVLKCNTTLADDEHQEVKDKAEAEWTDEVKSAWAKVQEEQKVKE